MVGVRLGTYMVVVATRMVQTIGTPGGALFFRPEFTVAVNISDELNVLVVLNFPRL